MYTHHFSLYIRFAAFLLFSFLSFYALNAINYAVLFSLYHLLETYFLTIPLVITLKITPAILKALIFISTFTTSQIMLGP